MIFTPKLLVNRKTANELKEIGAWNNDHMEEQKQLPTLPKFLQDACLCCELWDNPEQWYWNGCPVCTCKE